MNQQIAQTKYGPIEYRLEGQGPTVMVLQGGHCSRETRLSHEKLVGDGFTVLTPSRPGYDATPATVGATAQEAADALVALLDELHIAQVDGIAISAAGPTGLALAQRYPNRVRRLVLESAIATPWDPKTKRQGRLLFGRAETLTWGLLKLALKLAPKQVLRVMVQALTTLDAAAVMARFTADDVAFVHRFIETSQSGNGFIQDLEHCVDSLAGIKIPILFMYSPYDKVAPPTNVQRVATEVAHCQSYEVPAESHLIWIGPSADGVWQRRLAFLRA